MANNEFYSDRINLHKILVIKSVVVRSGQRVKKRLAHSLASLAVVESFKYSYIPLVLELGWKISPKLH